MIIKARHHWFYYPFFKWYSRRMPRKDFSSVTLHHEMEDRQLPILMIGNHVSWWDGFLAQYVNIELFNSDIKSLIIDGPLGMYFFALYII